MKKSEARQRAEKLRQEIRKYRYAYHVEDKELISPEALDSLKKELFDIEAEYPELITPDSPTQRVAGSASEKFEKVLHRDSSGEPSRMNSLSDAFSEEDFRDWFERLRNYLKKEAGKTDIKPEFYCDLKMDGLAVELVYERGLLVQGSTRGDGREGEDVTVNLRTIEAIPLKLRGSEFPDRLVVRGETYLTLGEFERINKDREKAGKTLYANPRNVAAGAIRQLDPSVTASRKLKFFGYALIDDGITTHEAEYRSMKEYGIPVNPHGRTVYSVDEAIKFRDFWEKERKSLNYEIDGVVITINDSSLFRLAGVAGKAPRGAVAYKFAPKEATTIVEDIKVQVGRTGALTPVATLRPVNIGGVTVSHASLHNQDEIRRLDVRIGDTVIASRAGDVIPQVVKVLPDMRGGDEKKFRMPEKCPIDGSKVVKDGAIHRCVNPNCGARHREALQHFVSRKAFNIEGLGPKIIDLFLDEGLISEASSLFELEEGDIAGLPGMGEKSAGNIIEEIEESKTISLPRFLYSLGIRHVGEETAVLLADNFPADNVESLAEKYKSLSTDDLETIPGIGPVAAREIKEWFSDGRNRELLSGLAKAGIEIEKTAPQKNSELLKGKTFALTGSLKSMTREEAKERIRSAGGGVSGSVSKKTDYLLAGNDPGSKYEKAKKLGVKVIGEEDLKNMLRK